MLKDCHSAVYDFENEGLLRDNVRSALTNDPLVQQLFAAAARKVAILNSIPRGRFRKLELRRYRDLAGLVDETPLAAHAHRRQAF